MELVNTKAGQYTEKYTTKEDQFLSKVSQQTLLHPHAHMFSGQVQGQFLKMISCIMKPMRILEIGTFTGYSALCLATGLQQGGKLHTIELREEDANTALTNFSNSSYSESIILHRGNALDIIPAINEEWDMVFIDADKTGYIDYYELTLQRLKNGGLIIADNVLFHGEVLEQNISGKSAKAIHAFNEHVAADVRTEQVMITIRDGVTLIRKL